MERIRQKNRGFTLVELMVAMTIGLVITLAVTVLFIDSRRSYQENDAASRMQENARFAMDMIIQDLRHASFFGNIPDPRDIDTSNAPAGGNDCAGGYYTFFEQDVTDPTITRYRIVEYGTLLDSILGTEFADCIDSTNVREGTSVLAIKRVASEGIPDGNPLDSAVVYVHANGASAQVALGGNSTLVGGEHWPYQPRVYYIDVNGFMRRTDATGGVGVEIAEGIDAIHVEFGVDFDLDGAPDAFYTAAADAVTDGTLDNAVTATVYVLARTTRDDQRYQDTKTYTMGSISMGPFDDGFHRRVYSSTTVLKNMRNQVTLRQGM